MVDVYAFAMTGYEILTVGKLPFELNGISDVAVLGALVRKERSIRPSPTIMRLSARSIGNVELRSIRPAYSKSTGALGFIEIVQDSENVTDPLLVTPKSNLPFWRKRWFIIIAVLLVVLIATGITLGVVLGRPQSTSQSSNPSSSPNHRFHLLEILPGNPPILFSRADDTLKQWDTRTEVNVKTSKIGGNGNVITESEIDSGFFIRNYTGQTAQILRLVVVPKSTAGILNLFTHLLYLRGILLDCFPVQTTKRYVNGIRRQDSLYEYTITQALSNLSQFWPATHVGYFLARLMTLHKNGIRRRENSSALVLQAGNSPRLFSSSEDKTIREWDTSTGKPVRVFTGHTEVVEPLVILPETQSSQAFLFSGSDDKKIIQWAL
ncbi:hypothetical protein HK098_005126 [Nowakowskiella sp. JEL0407]|nr:hypothetical protein HK098_005126 [Nowakowskiella sp. JEL0407]